MVYYKLWYFNLRLRGEIARLILNHAEVPFEDFRFQLSEWPQIKTQLPFGRCPVLEVDGKMLYQSTTIARYLARQHGLAGKDDWEHALTDMYGDFWDEILEGMRPVIKGNAPDKMNELFLKYNSDTIQPHLQKIERDLIKNGTGFLVGDSLTWPDLAYYSFLAPLAEEKGEDLILGNTPHLKKLFDRIDEIPQIKKYIESRPKTPM